jgi:hypothetical protein
MVVLPETNLVLPLIMRQEHLMVVLVVVAHIHKHIPFLKEIQTFFHQMLHRIKTMVALVDILMLKVVAAVVLVVMVVTHILAQELVDLDDPFQNFLPHL